MPHEKPCFPIPGASLVFPINFSEEIFDQGKELVSAIQYAILKLETDSEFKEFLQAIKTQLLELLEKKDIATVTKNLRSTHALLMQAKQNAGEDEPSQEIADSKFMLFKLTETFLNNFCKEYVAKFDSILQAAVLLSNPTDPNNRGWHQYITNLKHLAACKALCVPLYNEYKEKSIAEFHSTEKRQSCKIRGVDQLCGWMRTIQITALTKETTAKMRIGVYDSIKEKIATMLNCFFDRDRDDPLYETTQMLFSGHPSRLLLLFKTSYQFIEQLIHIEEKTLSTAASESLPQKVNRRVQWTIDRCHALKSEYARDVTLECIKLIGATQLNRWLDQMISSLILTGDLDPLDIYAEITEIFEAHQSNKHPLHFAVSLQFSGSSSRLLQIYSEVKLLLDQNIPPAILVATTRDAKTPNAATPQAGSTIFKPQTEKPKSVLAQSHRAHLTTG